MSSGLKLFLPVFCIVALWDAFTTVFGTIAILGGSSLGSIIMGILVSVVMIILFFFTFSIWSDDAIENEFMQIIFRALWLIAVSYDVFTSFYGNRAFIAGEELNVAGVAVVIMATVLVCGSTMIASWLLNED